MQTEPAKADPPKRKRRWFQFSLRALMIFTIVVAVACGWFGAKLERARNQKSAVEAILKNGGSIAYDYQHWDSSGKMIPNLVPPGSAWLRTLLGDDFFTDVVIVTAKTDDDLKFVRAFGRLGSLYLNYSQITDEGLDHI